MVYFDPDPDSIPDTDSDPEKIFFVLEALETVKYNYHFHAYEVKKADMSIICQKEAFLDHLL